MNPMTNVKNINKLNEIEARLGVAGSKTSWHEQYKDSAYIFVGGLPFDLTEGDIICVFSQYGEIMNINLVRDKKTGKSKGYCFLAYENQRSTILAVDNFNGIKLLGRVLRVDHVSEYRKPKEDENDDDVTKKLRQEGCAPRTPSPPRSDEEEEDYLIPTKKPQKEHKTKSKDKKKKKEKKKRKKDESESAKVHDDSSDSESGSSEKYRPPPPPVHVKREVDRGYRDSAAPPGSTRGGEREGHFGMRYEQDELLPRGETMRHRGDDQREQWGDSATRGERDSHRQRDREGFIRDPIHHKRLQRDEGRKTGRDRDRNREFAGRQETSGEERRPDRREERHGEAAQGRDRAGGRRDDREREERPDAEKDWRIESRDARREPVREWERKTLADQPRGTDRERYRETEDPRNWHSQRDEDRSSKRTNRDSYRDRETKRHGQSHRERDSYNY